MMNRLLIETQKPMALESVRELRHLLDRVTRVSVPSSSLRNRIALCLSEAVTNLVWHGARTGEIRLRFGKESAGWWLELEDDGEPWDPTKQEVGDTLSRFEANEHGRGVALLHTLCDHIDYLPGNTEKYNLLRMTWQTPKQHRQPRVLIVEDDLALSRLYAAYLSDNFEVQTATDGHDALQQLNTGDIDLVLSDIHMPGMDGLDLRESLNQENHNELTPFIFLTAADDPSTQQKAASLGIDDFLIKPIDKTQLIGTIQRVLERSHQIYRQLTDRIERRITTSLTPRLPESCHGWRLRVANRHTGVGGGDLLLYRHSHDHLLLSLGDIMGHDDSAKFFSYAYAGYLRGLMHADTTAISPDRLLEMLSESALQDNLLSQTTLTCCMATLAEGGRITLASAGHPQPLRISTTGITPLPVGGMLPGLLSPSRYTPLSTTLPPGERIALYTDGLFESASDELARKRLESAVTKSLADNLGQPIDQALEHAMEVFDRIAETPPKDDALLLLMEVDSS